MPRPFSHPLKKYCFIVLLACFLLPGCTQQADLDSNVGKKLKAKDYPTGITIGLIPEVNIFEQKKRYQPLLDYLSSHLEMNVKSLVTGHYGSIQAAFDEGKIDVAVHGSLNFAFLDRFVGVEPLVRPLWKNNVSTYSGYIVTRRDSGLSDDVSKWRGKRLSLVSRSTTAGYFYPLEYLRKRGVDNLEHYFADVIFAGSHDASLLAVYNGDADVGAGKNHVFNKLAESNPDFKENMVIIDKSDEVPSNTFSASKRLNSRTRDHLRQVLVEMSDNPEGRAILDAFGALRFVSTTRDDFKPVFNMISSMKIDLADPLYTGQ
jgi:phosphonate transport system substrate-binding protein